MAALNAATLALTFHAPQVDGFRVAGFPFTFHRAGGDCFPEACGNFAFHAGYFVADAAIALGIAWLCGAMAVVASRILSARRTGSPR